MLKNQEEIIAFINTCYEDRKVGFYLLERVVGGRYSVDCITSLELNPPMMCEIIFHRYIPVFSEAMNKRELTKFIFMLSEKADYIKKIINNNKPNGNTKN
jgi:hypothetical protein